MSLIASGRRRGATQPEPPPMTGRDLVWHDEFVGPALRQADWNATFRSNNPNNEEQVYTPRMTNVRIEDSLLVLESHRETYLGKEFTSGRVDTNGKHEFHYGLIQARMKLPVGVGLWSAFWTLGWNFHMATNASGVATSIGHSWPACGEIDILEAARTENWSYTTNVIHADGIASGSKTAHNSLLWHTYEMNWTPGEIAFSVDGGPPFQTVDVSGISSMQTPHYLIINLALGGTGISEPTTAETPDTAQVLVDWVRVWTPLGEQLAVPASLILSHSTVSVASGAQAVIGATITPANAHDKGIQWTTSDPSVAIVGGGYVTAVSPGAATVTATTWNGLTASCQITVTP